MNKGRFVNKEDNKLSVGTIGRIIVDSETGVQYLLIVNPNGISVTPLLNSDGKPLLDFEYKVQ